jgi:hypothetical protein
MAKEQQQGGAATSPGRSKSQLSQLTSLIETLSRGDDRGADGSTLLGTSQHDETSTAAAKSIESRSSTHVA